jgi:hypothetical protein
LRKARIAFHAIRYGESHVGRRVRVAFASTQLMCEAATAHIGAATKQRWRDLRRLLFVHGAEANAQVGQLHVILGRCSVP